MRDKETVRRGDKEKGDKEKKRMSDVLATLLVSESPCLRVFA